MDRKYVIFEDKTGCDTVFLFPVWIDHAEILKIVPSSRIQSAGFFSVSDSFVSVWGQSVSLKVKSRKLDARIIQKFLFSN